MSLLFLTTGSSSSVLELEEDPSRHQMLEPSSDDDDDDDDDSVVRLFEERIPSPLNHIDIYSERTREERKEKTREKLM